MSQAEDSRENEIRELLRHPEKFHRPIKWFMNVLKVGRFKYHLGYCTYGKGIAFVTRDWLTSFFVTDVTVTSDGCSDYRWCFNISCQFSHPDPEYLRKRGIKNEKELKKFYERLKEIERKLKEAGYNLDNIKCERVSFEKPILQVVKKTDFDNRIKTS